MCLRACVRACVHVSLSLSLSVCVVGLWVGIHKCPGHTDDAHCMASFSLHWLYFDPIDDSGRYCFSSYFWEERNRVIIPAGLVPLKELKHGAVQWWYRSRCHIRRVDGYQEEWILNTKTKSSFGGECGGIAIEKARLVHCVFASSKENGAGP